MYLPDQHVPSDAVQLLAEVRVHLNHQRDALGQCSVNLGEKTTEREIERRREREEKRIIRGSFHTHILHLDIVFVCISAP